MSRYVIGSRRVCGGALDDGWPLLPALRVDAAEVVDTGLVDQHGVPVWRVPRAVGFGVDED